jgi:hypothetical protein
MDRRQESTIRKSGVFTLAQGKEIGLSQQDISRLVAAKDLKRVGRGIYLHPDAKLEQDVGFQIACAKFGSGGEVKMTKQEIIEMTRHAGFDPVERDTVYNRVAAV